MKSYVRCKNVCFESNRVESFYDLQLNIKGKANGMFLIWSLSEARSFMLQVPLICMGIRLTKKIEKQKFTSTYKWF